MDLGGGDRRRIDILQGRNRLKGAQNNILRLKWFKSCQLMDIVYHFPLKVSIPQKQRKRPKQAFSFVILLQF